MSDLYSVIPGLQPTSQELLEAELLCKQILEAQYPTLDLREGTGLRDLVLRPSALLMALVKKGSDYLFTQNSLAGVTDATPTDLVDSILSNWFLTRNIGTKSVISTRLFFARRKNISISTDIFFSTDNVSKFIPSVAASYSGDSMVFDSYSNEYYIDVDMTAEKEGSTYNIGSGSLLYFSNFDPYFLRGEINFLKSESINSESNTQFIQRAQSAISTRNLINVPSIDSNLRAAFNYISRLTTVGMGDPEMVRDQLKAVFEDEAPRFLTSLTSSGTTATATLAGHGYNNGQLVNIAGATPSGYNGQYAVTVLSVSTFTYTLSGTLGAVTGTPNVAAVNNPILLHNGGMVDVYCSDKLATAIVQVTLDSLGRASLTGPIYDFSRSSITGGISADTVPLNDISVVTAINISSTTATATTSAPHSFILGDTVTVSGATQLRTVSAISCSGTTVTVTVTGHQYVTGNTVVISGVTPTTYNGSYTLTYVDANTFTYQVPVTIGSSGSGTMKAQVDLVNGVNIVTGVSTSTFSYTIPQVSTFPVSGTMSAVSPVNYISYTSNTQSKTLTSITSTGTVATVTLPKHGYTIGRYITISNSTPTGYNGSWIVKSIINQDQFTFYLTAPVGGTSTTGNIVNVIPWKDYGFSQNQEIIVDMGAARANLTASFNISYFQNLDSIQTYLNSPANRVLCGDYLARGFNFYLLHVEVTSYNDNVPNSTLVTTVINSYLGTLTAGDMFVMSDMMAKLRVNGIINIQNPPLVTFKKYNRDLTPVETGTITDILDPNDRTNVFLLDSVVTKAQNINPNTLVIS
jgi:hypothetical protein